MNKKISIVIPVYNEMQTISSVIEIARLWDRKHELIVINDGSTDASERIVKSFRDHVKLINFPKNKGKGCAMAKGIEESVGDFVMFLDGDIIGMSHSDLDAMIKPFESRNNIEMVMGISRFWSAGKFEPFNELTGQRVIRKNKVLPLLPKLKKAGYGAEILLNDYFGENKIVKVRLPHMFVLGKFAKLTLPKATQSFMVEAKQLVSQFIKLQTLDLSPSAKKLITKIYNYLKSTLESIE